MKRYFSIIIFICFHVSAQENEKTYAGISVEYNRMDFFLSGTCGKREARREHEAGLGLGINRTFFQQRIYPRTLLRSTFFIVNLSKIKVGLSAAHHFSFLNINRLKKSYQYYHEGLLGLKIECGTNFSFWCLPEAGILTQSFRSAVTGYFTTVYGFQYALQIGLKYVW